MSSAAPQSRAAEEQKLREGVEAELRRVQGELQEHKARAEQLASQAESRLADARRALQAAEERAAALAKDVDDAQSATKVLLASADHLSCMTIFENISMPAEHTTSTHA